MSIWFNVYGIVGAASAGEKKYYIVPKNRNSIFLADVSSWNIQWVCDLPWDSPFFAVDIYERDNTIWCVARKGLQIVCYDLTSKKLSLYFGEDEERDNLVSVITEEDIIILPKDLPGKVVRFSISQKEYHDMKDWNNSLEKLNIRDHLRAHVVDGKKIAATLKTKPSILIFDIDACSTYEEKFSIQDTFFGIATTENGYCLTSYSKKGLYFFDSITKNIIFYGNQNGCGYYNQVFKAENQYILSGIDSLDIFKSGIFRSIIPPTKKTSERTGSPCVYAQSIGSIFLMWPWSMDKTIVIDINTLKYKEYIFQMNFGDYVNVYHNIAEEDLLLIDYIKEIEEHKTEKSKNTDETCVGNIIYKQIKGLRV